MQKFLISSAMIVALAGPSLAGGYTEPAIEPAPFVVEETGGIGGWGAAAAVLGGAALIALLASDDDDDDDSSSTGSTD